MAGRIDISKLKVPPEKHELDTARFFADRGYDIEFIPPSNIPEVHRPDILMTGIEWERLPAERKIPALLNELNQKVIHRVSVSAFPCQTIIDTNTRSKFLYRLIMHQRLLLS